MFEHAARFSTIGERVSWTARFGIDGIVNGFLFSVVGSDRDAFRKTPSDPTRNTFVRIDYTSGLRTERLRVEHDLSDVDVRIRRRRVLRITQRYAGTDQRQVIRFFFRIGNDTRFRFPL